MQGDFSSSPYRPEKRHSSVRMQQGRVWLDSDWNEAIEILSHLERTEAIDVIGCCGVPMDGGGFNLALLPGATPSDLTLGAGRIYVGGTLCEVPGAAMPADRVGPKKAQLPDVTLGGRAVAVGQWMLVLEQKIIAGPVPVPVWQPLGNARVTSVDAGRLITVAASFDLPSPMILVLLSTYRTQPDFPISAADELTAGTAYVAYLDVWQRHISAIEEPDIREVALGGPDTATRTRTVAQVRLQSLPANVLAPTCDDYGPCWSPDSARSTARLRARAEPDLTAADPCVVPASAGYRRLENQLYRVEIHSVAAGGKPATFKWSRDNASVVYALESSTGLPPKQLKLAQPARDSYLSLAPDDWVELVDDDYTLSLQTKPLFQVDSISEGGDVVTLKVAPTGATGQDPTKHPYLCRWDHQPPSGAADGVIPVTEGVWIELEDGVQVQFEPGGQYQVGDHWRIPARTALNDVAGDVLWPRNGTDPRYEARHGTEHAYCVLGILRPSGSSWTISDCRPIFPALTDLVALHYVGGDGQEGPPSTQLDRPLQAGVANGGRLVAGAQVRFRVTSPGSGLLTLAPGLGTLLGASGSDVTVSTNAGGVAGVMWTLNGSEPSQTVEATLKSPDPGSSRLPLRFGASLRAARGGIHILNVLRAGDLKPLLNDGTVTIDQLRGGIRVVFDAPMASESVRRPTFFVTAELPVAFQSGGIADLRVTPAPGPVFGPLAGPVAGPVVGPVIGAAIAPVPVQPVIYQPVVLRAIVDPPMMPASGPPFPVVEWKLMPEVISWLENSILPVVARSSDRGLLLHLTLKGSFIWERDGSSFLYLDGESVEVPDSKLQATMMELPSGDGLKGGDFEMWFWLVPGRIVPPRRFVDVASYMAFPRADQLAGRVTRYLPFVSKRIGDLTGVMIQNMDPTQSATVAVDFYPLAGGAPVTIAVPAIAPLSAHNIYLPSEARLTAAFYAAVISGDRQLAAIARTDRVDSGGAAIFSTAAPSTSLPPGAVALPLVMKKYQNQTSTVNVHNTDLSQQTTVILKLFQPGTTTPVLSKSYPIVPGASIMLDLSANPDFAVVPTGFLGSMTVESKTRVAVQALLQNDVQAGLASYEGEPVENASDTLFVPLFRNALAGTTSIAVMNPGLSPVQVTVDYLVALGSQIGQTFKQGPVTIAPGSSALIFHGNTPVPGLPKGCAGTAVIRSVGGKVLATVIDADPVAGTICAHNAVGPAAASMNVVLPLWRKEHTDLQLSSSIYVMNVGTGDANAEIKFTNSSGVAITCPTECKATISSSGLKVWDTRVMGALTSGTFGAATIASTNPIVVLIIDGPPPGGTVDPVMPALDVHAVVRGAGALSSGDQSDLKLADIRGVGKARQQALEAAGVSHPAGVADLSPERATEILGVSEAQAVRIIGAAKELMDR